MKHTVLYCKEASRRLDSWNKSHIQSQILFENVHWSRYRSTSIKAKSHNMNLNFNVGGGGVQKSFLLDFFCNTAQCEIILINMYI